MLEFCCEKQSVCQSQGLCVFIMQNYRFAQINVREIQCIQILIPLSQFEISFKFTSHFNIIAYLLCILWWSYINSSKRSKTHVLTFFGIFGYLKVKSTILNEIFGTKSRTQENLDRSVNVFSLKERLGTRLYLHSILTF